MFPLKINAQITLPSPLVMQRSKSLSYFVVFTTTPRSPCLAQEIAADATISITLLRQVSIKETPSSPFSPFSPLSSTSSNTSSDDLSPIPNARKSFFRRKLARSAGSSRENIFQPNDNLSPPILPVSTIFSESHTLLTNMFIGFPKRPRLPCYSQSHPSLEAYASLPDGLLKGKFQFAKDVIPSIDWAGVQVKVSRIHFLFSVLLIVQ
jgi:hypothetical protein